MSSSSRNKRGFDAMAGQGNQEELSESSDSSDDSMEDDTSQGTAIWLHKDTDVPSKVLPLLLRYHSVRVFCIREGLAQLAPTVQALKGNTTVRVVEFILDYKVHDPVPEEACEAIRSLIANTRTIESMRFRVADGFGRLGTEMLTNVIVDTLATTNIRKIQVPGWVYNNNYGKICRAMEHNPNLRKVEAVFW